MSQRDQKYYNMESYPFEWKLEAERLEIKVRLLIFTITGACAGLPALVWSVSKIKHHRRNGHHISAFIILLLTDFVELFLSPYILKYLLDEFSSFMDWTFRVLWSLWGMSKACGLLLNQLVALEGILSVKYPLYAASALSPCFIIFFILMILCIIIGQVFLHSVYYLFVAVLVLIVSVITWIISCGVSCCADCHSHTSRKPDHHILVVFIFTLLVIYLPFTVFSFFIYFNP